MQLVKLLVFRDSNIFNGNVTMTTSKWQTGRTGNTFGDKY